MARSRIAIAIRSSRSRRCSRDELLAEWEDGWRRVFDALAPLTDADLQETVYIRQEPHSIYKAISRQVAHYAGHAYQILLLAKHLKGADWKTLSVPRGQSEEFNRADAARSSKRARARDGRCAGGCSARRTSIAV